jgi:Ca-activated chloride channel family protein
MILQNFIKTRKNDRIGLVVFAGKAYSLCPLTNDYELLLEYIQDINSKLIDVSGTAIGDALAVGINRMREINTNSKVIILLSDGESLEGNLPPSIAAQLAKKFNIKVYSIAIGKNKSGENPVDTKSLKDISKITNGKFFNANDNQTLRSVFNEIDKIEKNKLHDIRLRPMEDFYGVYINWAIVTLLLSLLLKSTFMGNIFED